MKNKKKKIYKGQPGYFSYRKKQLLIGSLTGFLMMFLFFLTGYLIYGTAKNLITILAVLVVLPTAKIYIQYMMLPWKHGAEMDFYNRIKTQYTSFDLYAELLITGSEKRFDITYLAIDKEDNIIAYTMDEKADEKKFETAVVNFLNYYNFDSKVSLFKDIESFEKKIKKISTGKELPAKEQKEHMELVFEKLSIMSI